MKKRISFVLILLLAFGLVSIFRVFGEGSDKEKCIDFLNSYGWAVEESGEEAVLVTIPAKFDKVYENYNEIQKKSNLDLLPYRGKSGMRYTFIVKNYPVDVGEEVYANVLIIDRKAVGGDIMTVSLGGFMHGLGENTPE